MLAAASTHLTLGVTRDDGWVVRGHFRALTPVAGASDGLLCGRDRRGRLTVWALELPRLFSVS